MPDKMLASPAKGDIGLNAAEMYILLSQVCRLVDENKYTWSIYSYALKITVLRSCFSHISAMYLVFKNKKERKDDHYILLGLLLIGWNFIRNFSEEQLWNF